MKINRCYKVGVTLGGLLLGGAVLGNLAGCELFSAVAYQANGPAAIPAKYVPPQEPTLLFVENYSGGAVQATDTSSLIVDLMRELKDNKVAPLIDQDVLETLKDKTPADTYSQMTISQIGRACGAEQVIYVHVLGATVTVPKGSQSITGTMEVRVKVVDVKTGQTRWPDSSEGSDEKITTPVFDNTIDSTEVKVHQNMADMMAVHLGNLFHEWKPQYENQER